MKDITEISAKIRKSNAISLLRRFGSILPSFTIKMMGAILSFASIQQTVSVLGLSLFGIYTQITTIYILFSSIASLGFANAFIRDNAKKTRDEKKTSYQNIRSIVFLISLLLAPIMIAFVKQRVESENLAIFIITCTFILFSDFRIRFSFLRISGREAISEAPMILIKPAVIIICLTCFRKLSLSNMLIIFFISELASYYFQTLISKDLGIFDQFKGIKNMPKNLNKIDIGYGIWLSNCLNNLKTYLNLAVISIIFNNASSAEYKILLMFSTLLMSVYNSSNISSSHIYASWLIEGKIEKVNSLIFKNFLRCIVIYVPFGLALLVAAIHFNLLSYFDLSRDSGLSLIFICLPSFCALLLGPAPQLAIHVKKTAYINKLKAMGALLSALPLCHIAFWTERQSSLPLFILYLTFIEISIHLAASYYMMRKFNCIPPVLYRLKNKNSITA